MKRAELKELLRSAIYEGPTKRANKAKKKASGFSSSAVQATLDAPRSIDTHRVKAGAMDYKYAGSMDQVKPSRRANYDSTANQATRSSATHYGDVDPVSAIGKDKLLRRGLYDPAHDSISQWQGTDSSGVAKPSPVPMQVQRAASKDAGGKVRFGRYYDAQGNYLGRSQGGQWIDGKSDPNAKTQMEMYNKLMEIESGKYTSKDRELVKEMIREVVRSCG
jgi:hypothetical protein